VKVLKPKKSTPIEYILIGLGNPGLRYQETRHNVGFWFIKELSTNWNLDLKKALFRSFRYAHYKNTALVLPFTYMNRSGLVLPYLENRYPGAQILVVTDNMDLPPGKTRFKQKIGTGGGHNGLRSIVEYQGTDPWVLYIGVGRPPDRESVIDHVLGEPSLLEREKILSAISKGINGFHLIIAGEFQAGMNVINSSRD